MVIDLILDRKEVEKENEACITLYDAPINRFCKPIIEVFPEEDIADEFKNGFVWTYDPRAFYYYVLEYGEVGNGITAAMDYGSEKDVKQALCNYIDKQNYNPEIKNYINSVNWL